MMFAVGVTTRPYPISIKTSNMQAGDGVNAWNRATVATLLRRNSDTMANHEYRLRLEQYVVSSLPRLGTVRWLARMPTPNLLDTRLGPPRTLPIGIIQCVLRLYLVNCSLRHAAPRSSSFWLEQNVLVAHMAEITTYVDRVTTNYLVNYSHQVDI